MSARKVSDILGDSGELGTIAEAARRVARLQRLYLEAVPRELVESSRIGWARGDVLSITADNGAAAAKLRQIPARILHHMRQTGFEFSSMRIEIQVGRPFRLGAYRHTKPLSSHALSAIDRTLAEISDSPLKAALAMLSRRRR
jgi:hypothetical protein